MNTTNRWKFSSSFKAKGCLETLKEQQTIEILSKKYNLHPTQSNTWRRELVEHSSQLFEQEGKGMGENQAPLMEQFYAPIGQLKVRHDFLKKVNVVPRSGQTRLFSLN